MILLHFSDFYLSPFNSRRTYSWGTVLYQSYHWWRAFLRARHQPAVMGGHQWPHSQLSQPGHQAEQVGACTTTQIRRDFTNSYHFFLSLLEKSICLAQWVQLFQWRALRMWLPLWEGRSVLSTEKQVRGMIIDVCMDNIYDVCNLTFVY